jgi:hypothetical protein
MALYYHGFNSNLNEAFMSSEKLKSVLNSRQCWIWWHFTELKKSVKKESKNEVYSVRRDFQQFDVKNTIKNEIHKYYIRRRHVEDCF